MSGSPTKLAFVQHDQRPRIAVRSVDPVMQLYHDQWAPREFHRRHDVLDEWVKTPDAEFYAAGHSYIESLIRVTTMWLRRSSPRTPEQAVNLARAHGRKTQDVKRDLDRLLIERERAALVAQSKRADRETVRQEQATAQGYTNALAALGDGDDLDEDESS